MVGFPGTAGCYGRSSDTSRDIDRFTFVVRSGRAVLYPIYKSTFERADSVKSDYPNTTRTYRDHMIMWAKDVTRSVDHLQGHPDSAKDKVGYIGLSLGRHGGAGRPGRRATLLPGRHLLWRVRLAAIAARSGSRELCTPGELPVLMLSGRNDYFFPTVT
jgi:hypothetical protein